jgi:hypothetical protein
MLLGRQALLALQNTDPARLRVAVQLPLVLRPSPRGITIAHYRESRPLPRISKRAAGLQDRRMPDGPIYLTAYLKTAETVDYVTVARDLDLRSLIPEHVIAVEVLRCEA